MTDRAHPAATGTEVHAPVRWIFANDSARTAYNVAGTFADDVGCFAWQQDTNTVWLAISAGIGSGHWAQVGAAAAGTLVGPGSSTDFALATWNGTAGVTLRNSTLLTPSSGSDPTNDLHVTKKAYVDTRVRTARVTKVTHAMTPYTILDADEQILLDPTAGVITVVLPALTANRVIWFKDISNVIGTNNVTLQRPSGKKIEGVAADLVLSANKGSWVAVGDSTGTDSYWISGPI